MIKDNYIINRNNLPFKNISYNQIQIFQQIKVKLFGMSFVGNYQDVEMFSLTKLSSMVTFHGDEYSQHEPNYSHFYGRSNLVVDHLTESIID